MKVTDDTAMLTCDECEIATIFRQDKTKNPPDPACPICGKQRSCSFGDDIRPTLFGPDADAKVDDHKGCHNCGAVECWRCQLGQCRKWMPQPGPAEAENTATAEDGLCRTCKHPACDYAGKFQDYRGNCRSWTKCGTDDAKPDTSAATSDAHAAHIIASVAAAEAYEIAYGIERMKPDALDDDCPRCSVWESGRVVGVFRGNLLVDASDGSAAAGPMDIGSKDNPPLVIDVPGKPGCEECGYWTAKAICETGELPQPPPDDDYASLPWKVTGRELERFIQDSAGKVIFYCYSGGTDTSTVSRLRAVVDAVNSGEVGKTGADRVKWAIQAMI